MNSKQNNPIAIVPVRRDHYNQLHQWMNDPSSLFLWTNQRKVESQDSFYRKLTEKLERYYHSFFIIEAGEQAKPAGFTYSFNFDAIDGTIHFATVVDKHSRKQGIATAANVKLLGYLFTYFPIRKVYTDVYGYNSASLAAVKSGGFTMEGEFKQHRFFDGKYHTMYRFAMFREQFKDPKFQKSLEERIKRKRPSGSISTKVTN